MKLRTSCVFANAPLQFPKIQSQNALYSRDWHFVFSLQNGMEIFDTVKILIRVKLLSFARLHTTTHKSQFHVLLANKSRECK